VNGAPTEVLRRDPDMPAPRNVAGRPFRELVTHLATRTDLPPLTSVTASYRAPEQGFAIDPASGPIPAMRLDYLADAVRPERLTPALRAAMDARKGEELIFDDEGFALTEGGAVRRFDVTLDVPEIGSPTGAAIDTRRGLFYGVTVGGEGFLYALDPETGRWSVLRSMDGWDADGMLYDPVRDRLIVFGRNWGTDRLAIAILDPSQEARTVLEVERQVDDFPGLSDLYDVGNTRPPPLGPVAVDGDVVLLQTRGSWPENDPDARRSYVIDLASGEVALVGYRD
jgi:hypothetical protein